MEFRILGPLEAVDGDRTVPLGGPRQRALLALLLTHANRVLSAERLIDELWGDDAPAAASNALQYHVSQLRKTLAPHEAIVTQEPGYMIRVGPGELDLERFERLREAATAAEPGEAARLLREALALWRGSPLEDLAQEEFAQAEIRRLDELHVATIEQRIEVELEAGADGDLIGELETLVHAHPLRERLRAQLMLALYRAGRQAEALATYRDLRNVLVSELGIEPSRSLQELEQAILRQDPELSPGTTASAVVIVAGDDGSFDALLSVAEPLAQRPARELIVTRLLTRSDRLAGASAELADLRNALADRGVTVRVAAYVAGEAGAEAARFATEHNADLLLVEATSPLVELVLERAPCDVGLLVGASVRTTGPVVTPFGGVEHDWSAIEIAAWLAGALGTRLRLIGTEAEPESGRRDASRLLARASLLVQQVVGIVTEPVLVPAGAPGVVEAARDARLIVIGLSDRWRTEGIGSTRIAVAEGVDAPTLFVRRGLRPSGVAPSETMTRFTWTLGPQHSAPRPAERPLEGDLRPPAA
jgi:DNA-binding SARP family transcriptional activator